MSHYRNTRRRSRKRRWLATTYAAVQEMREGGAVLLPATLDPSPDETLRLVETTGRRLQGRLLAQPMTPARKRQASELVEANLRAGLSPYGVQVDVDREASTGDKLVVTYSRPDGLPTFLFPSTVDARIDLSTCPECGCSPAQSGNSLPWCRSRHQCGTCMRIREGSMREQIDACAARPIGRLPSFQTPPTSPPAHPLDSASTAK